ncbi:unnamed protein product [Adineta ricciae]|uniref:TLDc domain-containing protein n=1 Tax=Adineta ricciae TaxID=249248 RepID=A0A816A7Y8_ADIRI|nr:unnamed protein product [Adineta ricciae]
MDYDQQLFINQLSSIKYTEEKLDELNLPSKSSTGTINDENDLDLKTNIVQCLNEEVQSVRPFIQSKSDDQIVPKRSLFHLIIHGSKQFSSYKYQFYPSEGSLLNVIQWQKLISWSGKKDWKLLYKASRDGFHCKDFHRLCDNQGATITVIRTKQGYICGFSK